MWSCLEFCCMLYTRTTFPQICVFISGDRLIFGVFTVLFMKWSQMVNYNYSELFEIWKNWEFPETYLRDFTWYLYLGLQLRSPAQYTSAMCLCRQLLDYLLQPFRVLAPTLSAGELSLRKIEGPDRGSTIGFYYAVNPTRIFSPSRNLDGYFWPPASRTYS